MRHKWHITDIIEWTKSIIITKEWETSRVTRKKSSSFHTWPFYTSLFFIEHLILHFDFVWLMLKTMHMSFMLSHLMTLKASNCRSLMINSCDWCADCMPSNYINLLRSITFPSGLFVAIIVYLLRYISLATMKLTMRKPGSHGFLFPWILLC